MDGLRIQGGHGITSSLMVCLEAGTAHKEQDCPGHGKMQCMLLQTMCSEQPSLAVLSCGTDPVLGSSDRFLKTQAMQQYLHVAWPSEANCDALQAGQCSAEINII